MPFRTSTETWKRSKMLRERERNRFDAVVVAGDIGSKAATEIMAILATFACPVLYVLGNWDRDLPYDLSFGPTCHHLHLRSIECGGWAFAGFSGLPAGWGKNPIAAALRQEVEKKYTFASPNRGRPLERPSEREQRSPASEQTGTCGADQWFSGRPKPNDRRHSRTAFSCRERPAWLFPSLLFGHRHGFQSGTFRGARFVNVSVLDNPATVRPAAKAHCTLKDLRNINLGSYTIIEIDRDRFDARSVEFAPKFDRMDHGGKQNRYRPALAPGA